MDGDLARLPQIVELAKKYDALTMVDDAHGEGVLGKGGRGVVNHYGLEGEVDIEIGSLSKAFSVMGGFIAAKQPLIDAYLMSARQRLFSIALSLAFSAFASATYFSDAVFFLWILASNIFLPLWKNG